jgi:hypothetical protein
MRKLIAHRIGAGAPPASAIESHFTEIANDCWIEAAAKAASAPRTPSPTKAPTANLRVRLSDLDVAHKLARACGGEVIDTAVDGMADSDFLNQSDESQT